MPLETVKLEALPYGFVFKRLVGPLHELGRPFTVEDRFVSTAGYASALPAARRHLEQMHSGGLRVVGDSVSCARLRQKLSLPPKPARHPVPVIQKVTEKC